MDSSSTIYKPLEDWPFIDGNAAIRYTGAFAKSFHDFSMIIRHQLKAQPDKRAGNPQEFDPDVPGGFSSL